jgi:3-oxoacyl-[acyl-carrier-protein] synthase III
MEATLIRSVIAATGSHIPVVVRPNESFLSHEFHGADGHKLAKGNAEILKQFEDITGIRERRYVPDHLVASDIAASAAGDALASSGISGETLDYIILAHNFGDVRHGSNRPDIVPALAARVKARLGIVNPNTVALDLVFGCPGWLQGVIHADYMIRSGSVRRVMVIGAETLSRVCDPHDRDSLIYADGAGAVILEAREAAAETGILSHAVRSDTLEHAGMLFMGPSYKKEARACDLFLKMYGRRLYKYALSTVAPAVLEALRTARVDLRAVKKVLLHQANGKMDEAIASALYDLAGLGEPPLDVLPMTISWLGNSSVATIPTMLDLMRKGRLPGHEVAAGDVLIFASVGAGMHINAVVYREPVH